MHLKRRLRKLATKVENRTGTDTAGALRDMFTDMIHLCEEAGLDPTERFNSAREVADEEKGDEKEAP